MSQTSPPAPDAATSPPAPAAPAVASNRGLQLLVGVAAALVGLYGISQYSGVIGPVVLAIVIVIAAHPVQTWARSHLLPPWAVLSVSLLVIYGIVVGLVLLLVVSLARLATLLPSYNNRFVELQASVVDWFQRYKVDPSAIQKVIDGFDYGKVIEYVTGVVSQVASITSALLLILVLLFFVILDANGFNERLDALSRVRPDIADTLITFAAGTRRYLVVSTVFGFLVAVFDLAALYWLAVPLPLLWALVGFVTNYIPNVGFVIGVIPPMFLGLLEGGWNTALWVLGSYAVINFVIQSLIQPKFVGDSVGLSATATFVSLMLWTSVLGALGAILAVPLSLFFKCVLLDAQESTRWVSLLIGSNVKKDNPPPSPDSAEVLTAN